MSGSADVVLVTGGAGYVGSHACKSLARAGFLPVSFDNLVYGHSRAVRWGPLEVGDILDRGRLDEVIDRYKPIGIIHFAAFAYVGESVLDPGKYYRNNVAGSLALLEAARDHGVKRFIFSSSCSTYGVPKTVPIPEDSAQEPINPYGASKLMVERILADFEQAHGLRFMTLRYFNAAGADAECEIGENHDPETHLIPLAIKAAMTGTSELIIYGTDFLTPDGTAIRDYIHVTDLAEAHVLALNALLQNSESLALNLGTGIGHSVKDVVEMVERVGGCKVPVRFADRRAGDPPELVADPLRAWNRLHWKPMHSSFQNIIETAWRWHECRRKGC